jgi:hypothetical protein
MDRLECIHHILNTKFIPDDCKLEAIKRVMSPEADQMFGSHGAYAEEKVAWMEEPFEDRANR